MWVLCELQEIPALPWSSSVSGPGVASVASCSSLIPLPLPVFTFLPFLKQTFPEAPAALLRGSAVPCGGPAGLAGTGWLCHWAALASPHPCRLLTPKPCGQPGVACGAAGAMLI